MERMESIMAVVTDGYGTFTVGGSTPAAGNIIAYNGGSGIRQFFFGAARLNSIFANGGLGIDKGGQVLNDPQDTDAIISLGTSLLNLQNYPVLASATKNADGSLTISGVINSNPSVPLMLDFYGNDQWSIPADMDRGRRIWHHWK